MSGRKLDNAIYNFTTDWKDETEYTSFDKKGFYNIEFTNMDSLSAPAIAAGSAIGVGGVSYVFDSEEAITGSPSDGVVYVIITGGASATAAFTNTVPTWSASKNGYYISSDRAVLKLELDTTEYMNKVPLEFESSMAGFTVLDSLQREPSPLEGDAYFSYRQNNYLKYDAALYKYVPTPFSRNNTTGWVISPTHFYGRYDTVHTKGDTTIISTAFNSDVYISVDGVSWAKISIDRATWWKYVGPFMNTNVIHTNTTSVDENGIDGDIYITATIYVLNSKGTTIPSTSKKGFEIDFDSVGSNPGTPI